MTLFDEMMGMVKANTTVREENVVHEVMQRIALAGLARGGFFDHAAFYGGTCLHLLFGMDRFSEDMDFSLLSPEEDFETYFPAVVDEFKLAGKDVEIKMKHKGKPTSIESAFLKETADVFDIGFTTGKRIKVKIEVDTDPPPDFQVTEKTIQNPRTCWIRSFDMPSLFAGKVSAALFRNWKHRVKGRDWYDVSWLISHNVELNIAHLVERAGQFAPEVDISSRDLLIAAFDERIDEIDFDNARDDVLPYLKDGHEVDIWSRKLFHDIVRKIKIAE